MAPGLRSLFAQLRRSVRLTARESDAVALLLLLFLLLAFRRHAGLP